MEDLIHNQKKSGVNKIMLMYPNVKWTEWISRTVWDIHPYNLGLLTAKIEDKYDVSIIDGTRDDLSKEQFTEIIKKENPDMLGISVLTNEYAKAGHIASNIAKKINPGVITVMGGVHTISTPSKEIMKGKSIDYLVKGEATNMIRDFCDYLNGEKDMPKKGIVYRKNGEIIDTGRTDFIEDLDSLPLPSYSKIDFTKYTTKIQREDISRPRELPYTRILTSRGCPYNCCFCEAPIIGGKKFRLRSIENVLNEIDWLIDDYGIKSLVFDDDNLLFDKLRAKGLFREMAKRNLKWIAPAVAVYKLDGEMVGLMKESGCQFIDIAIESGVERVLKDIIHKPVRLYHAKKMIDSIKKHEIDLCANFVFGFPGETWNEIRETIKFAEDIDVDYVKLFIATPVSANTELYKKAKEKGYLVDGFHFDQHLWTDGWIQTEEFRPQDLRILRAYEWDRINFSTPEKRKKIAGIMGITEQRLDEIRKDTLKRANS